MTFYQRYEGGIENHTSNFNEEVNLFGIGTLKTVQLTSWGQKIKFDENQIPCYAGPCYLRN